jgi:dihydroorotate dehydrogenase (NAD+) catalytic subunit
MEMMGLWLFGGSEIKKFIIFKLLFLFAIVWKKFKYSTVMNLQTTFLGQTFKNPLVTASGILGVTADSEGDVIRHGAGGITTKSIHLHPRKGHKNPTVLELGEETGMINAVGLSGEGIDSASEEYVRFKEKYPDIPLIVNIFGGTVEEFGEVAKRASNTVADIIEVNISCPNVEDEFGIPFSCDTGAVQQVTREVKKYCPNKPVVLKLSPNVPNIGKIARAVEEAGADGICAINTVGPGMVIDPYMRSPVLSNKVGGVSGRAIKPIALKCIWDIHKAVKIPIIGTGGAETGLDAIEMIMAGATLIGIGTGVYSRGIEVFSKVQAEMMEFMNGESIKNLDEIRGII